MAELIFDDLINDSCKELFDFKRSVMIYNNDRQVTQNAGIDFFVLHPSQQLTFKHP